MSLWIVTFLIFVPIIIAEDETCLPDLGVTKNGSVSILTLQNVDEYCECNGYYRNESSKPEKDALCTQPKSMGHIYVDLRYSRDNLEANMTRTIKMLNIVCGCVGFNNFPLTCEPGFKRSKKKTCDPHCTKCPDYSACIEPETCRCDYGYLMVDNNICEPQCSDKCPLNSACTRPDTCQCYEGYRMLENSTCEPQCSYDCPFNSECVRPDFCQCGNGYRMLENNTCEPQCLDGCPANSACVEPENCQCDHGYHMFNNTSCQPQCLKGCPAYGICVEPDNCQCMEGYQMSATNICEPYCKSGCIHGHCTHPETCQCDLGYTLSIENICELEERVTSVESSTEMLNEESNYTIMSTITAVDEFVDKISEKENDSAKETVPFGRNFGDNSTVFQESSVPYWAYISIVGVVALAVSLLVVILWLIAEKLQSGMYTLEENKEEIEFQNMNSKV